jgi:hypothetical protein
LEGLYSRDYNPAVIRNVNMHQIGNQTLTLAPGDVRPLYTSYNKSVNPYLITNAGDGAYYYSITASLAKKFDFGLNVRASYTYSRSRSYSDGTGDQVTSAYSANRYSVGAVNGEELGYGTYVSPNRLLISANYRKEYAKNFATTVGLVYDGMNSGFVGTYRYSRYSYTLGSNVIGDRGANNLLYVPESRAALDDWHFTDLTDTKGNVYTADEQRNDFWAFIQQDDYLKDRTGKHVERGGAIMPWHHQLDLKFLQDFYVNVGGKRNTLQLGVDIENLLNLINKKWGLYKQVNSMFPLNYNAQKDTYNFPKLSSNVLSETFTDYNDFYSTYRIQFSIRYIFN